MLTSGSRSYQVYHDDCPMLTSGSIDASIKHLTRPPPGGPRTEDHEMSKGMMTMTDEIRERHLWASLAHCVEAGYALPAPTGSHSPVPSLQTKREQAGTPSTVDGNESRSSSLVSSPSEPWDRGHGAHKRKWTEMEKEKHSDACRQKDRLTLADKLRIIDLHASGKNQVELAQMFNKSRMTISKLLRPDSIAKAQALAISGVRLQAKRCKRVKYPELERRVYEAVGKGARPTSKAEILSKANEIAQALHIVDLEATNNWCTRFIQQHDLTIGSCHKPAHLSEDARVLSAPMPVYTTSNMHLGAQLWSAGADKAAEHASVEGGDRCGGAGAPQGGKQRQVVCAIDVDQVHALDADLPRAAPRAYVHPPISTAYSAHASPYTSGAPRVAHFWQHKQEHVGVQAQAYDAQALARTQMHARAPQARWGGGSGRDSGLRGGVGEDGLAPVAEACEVWSGAGSAKVKRDPRNEDGAGGAGSSSRTTVVPTAADFAQSFLFA